MITEDYISFETAKLLKEKGFNEVTSHVYSDTKELLRLTDYGTKDLTNKDCDEYTNWLFPIEEVTDIISAPTLQMTMKWLREIKEVFIAIGFCDYPSLHKTEWIPEISTHDSVFPDSAIAYDTYEKACEEAIKYCLNNLI